jgi:aspartyl-tRNA(Asn)/glutamyl-tRNA(Gln) amidotransferase subunit A
MLGTYALSAGYYDAYYLTALKARRRIKEDFDRAFASGLHAVLTPTTTGPAFRLGEKTDDPLAMYLEDIYTVTANLAGLPAISLPMGFAREGGRDLPLGLQIMAPAFGEETLLRAARMFEQSGVHPPRAPALA